ncbi:MAG: hypothetical protein AABZ32_01245 [Bacteroidota bacterium]
MKVTSFKLQVTSYKFWLLASGFWLLNSCGSGNDILTPKPFAYFRIDLPEKKYSVFSDSCPF